VARDCWRGRSVEEGGGERTKILFLVTAVIGRGKKSPGRRQGVLRRLVFVLEGGDRGEEV